MYTELHALNVLGVPYKHAFASEIWEPAIRYIRANHRPCVMHHDMTQRALKAAPKCDLYLCSSPCQPVSVMNAKKKIDDKRREPLSHALDYIRAKQPKYWVFENVLGLMRVDKGSVWRSLCSQLDAMCMELGYRWSYQVLDPCKHADSPQSRPRVYICGRKGDTQINWPSEVPLTKRCVELLDARARPTGRTRADSGTLAACYKRQLAIWGITPGEDEGIVEFCASSRAHSPYKNKEPLTSKQRAHVLKADIAPCMIKHDPGLYAVHLDRMLTADECLLLQGHTDPSKVTKPQVTDLQMRQLCGNAMHMGVLACVLECLLDESDM